MPLFKIGQIVEHRKGGKYYILAIPNPSRILERDREPFYEYSPLGGGNTYLRCQSEMEDG
jgi:hypothetical protein